MSSRDATPPEQLIAAAVAAAQGHPRSTERIGREVRDRRRRPIRA